VQEYWRIRSIPKRVHVSSNNSIDKDGFSIDLDVDFSIPISSLLPQFARRLGLRLNRIHGKKTVLGLDK